MSYEKRTFTSATDGSVFDSEQEAINNEIITGIRNIFNFYDLKYIDSFVVYNSAELQNIITNCNKYDNTNGPQYNISFPCVILKFKNKDDEIKYKFFDDVINSYDVLCMKLKTIKSFADRNL